MGTDPDRPYMWTWFADLVLEGSGPDDRRQTKASITFQSSFPPYIQREGDIDSVCGFVRGENSCRVTFYWENWNAWGELHPDTYLPHAYMKGCVVDYTDNWTNNIRSFGTEPLSRYEDGDDILDLYGTSSQYARIVEEGTHLGAPRNKGGSTLFFRQGSVLEDLPSGTNVRHCMGVATPHRNGYYSYDYWTTATNYRVIHGKAFSSMEEWFQYCKTH